MNAYTAVCRDGLRVVCPFTDGPREIRFGDDPPLPLPFHGLFVVAAQQPDGDHWAVLQAAEGVSPTLLVKRRARSVETLRPACGQDPVWVTEQGHVLLSLCAQWWIDHDPPVPFPIGSGVEGGTSQGFAWVEPDGRPHFMDHHPEGPLHPDGRKIIHGIEAIRLRRSGDWQVFQASVGTFEGVLVHRLSTDELWIAYVGKTIVGPGLCEQADGSAVVALSLPARFLGPADWQPWVTPTPPPIVVPAPPAPVPTPSPAPAPPPPAHIPDEESPTMPLPKTIAFAAAPYGVGSPAPLDQIGTVNPHPDGTHFTVTWGPTVQGHPPVHPDTVFSLQPDGSYQTRPAGAAGEYETFAISGNFLVCRPNWRDGAPLFPNAPSTAYAIPFVVIA